MVNYGSTTGSGSNPVNVTGTPGSYNAVGDGATHPLSSYFASVSAATSAFSAAATATGLTPVLTDELNWWVIQTYLADGNQVFLPKGTYLLHRALILPNGFTTGITIRGAGKGVSVLKLRSHTVSGGLADCSVIIDAQLLAAATSSPGIGYNYNNAINAALSSYLTLADFTVDGNSANVGSGFYAGYNYGIGVNAMADITVSNVDCRNVNGWGYRDAGTQVTAGTYTERGCYSGMTVTSCAYWGFYFGFRNRKKSVVNAIATGCGTNGLCGTVKGSVQTTAPGGFFLDCSEMTCDNIQAHGNNGDGIFIRNVFSCQYKGLKATFNGGSGIHVMGLVNSHGSNWLAQNNGTNPGNGQNNLASPAPDSGGTGSGGAGTYTGAVDVYFDDSTNTYGLTNLSAVADIECGVNATVAATWGYAGAEVYGIWLDDGMNVADLVISPMHNTSSQRYPTGVGAANVNSALALRDIFLRPNLILGETITRSAMLNSSVAITSGTLFLTAVPLLSGVSVGHLKFYNNGAAVSPTHWWFALFDSSLNMLAVTADRTSTAWNANTPTSLAIATIASGAATSFTTTYTGLYYVGIMMAAGTTVTLIGGGHAASGVIGDTPVLAGASTASLTTPPSFPSQATAIAAGTGLPYATVLP